MSLMTFMTPMILMTFTTQLCDSLQVKYNWINLVETFDLNNVINRVTLKVSMLEFFSFFFPDLLYENGLV